MEFVEGCFGPFPVVGFGDARDFFAETEDVFFCAGGAVEVHEGVGDGHGGGVDGDHVESHEASGDSGGVEFERIVPGDAFLNEPLEAV